MNTSRHLPWQRLLLLFTTCLLVLPPGSRGGAPTSAERPNFLLLIADDLNWRDLGCTGSPDVQSPHIDRLASEGMALRGMFASATTCSPARHALYTGLYPVRSGAYPNHTMVDEATRSLFTHLRAMGYRVGLQAKQHVHPAFASPET
jgi:N-sulfoglucosamine sulfohydrolase